VGGQRGGGVGRWAWGFWGGVTWGVAWAALDVSKFYVNCHH